MVRSVQPPVKWLHSCDCFIHWFTGGKTGGGGGSGRGRESRKNYNEIRLKDRWWTDGRLNGQTDRWLNGVNEMHDWWLKISFPKCREINKRLVYSLTDGRIDGMIGERRCWRQKKKKEREDGGLLKHPASQRKEINGVSLSGSVALCAKLPFIKHTPHIWHKSRAWGTSSSLFYCFSGGNQN